MCLRPRTSLAFLDSDFKIFKMTIKRTIKKLLALLNWREKKTYNTDDLFHGPLAYFSLDELILGKDSPISFDNVNFTAI